MAQAQGRLQEINSRLGDLSSSLRSERFTDLDRRLRKARIQYEVSLMVQEDLHRYHGALDKALMRYHSKTMEDINVTLRELWQSVYKGGDIEAIQIRSDVSCEETGEEGVKTGRKSYNYRVTMTKASGVEVDMRGRCSAGQKVLASLIIRLALADSFCCQCGIMALDEPTTNLDKHNVEGLALAFSRLIEKRRHQRHFQLMIITHDEAFVRHLNQLEVCENYYHISKNQAGFSTLEKRPLRNV